MKRKKITIMNQNLSSAGSFLVILAGCILITLLILERTGFLSLSIWNMNSSGIRLFAILLITANFISAGFISSLVILFAKLNRHTRINNLDIHSQLEHAPLAVMVINHAGKILYSNAFTTILFGYKKEELFGLKIKQLIPELYRSNQSKQRAQFNQKTDKPQPGDLLNLFAMRKDKVTFPVEVALSSVRTNNGISTMCYVQDITERKQNESMLKESEAKYRSLYQNGLVGILRASYPDGRLQEANQGFLDMFGYQSISELPLNELYVSPNDFKQTMDSLEERGEFHDFNILCLRNNGTSFWASMSAMLFRDNGYLESALIDIDKRVSTERELAHSLSLMQATLESSNDGILALDRQTKPVYYNQHFLTLWDLSQTEIIDQPTDLIIGKMVSQIVDPKDFLSIIDETTQYPEQDSYIKVTLLGNRIYEISSNPQRIGEEIVGRVWITRDITQRTNSETTLQKALAETRQASTSLTKMVNELEKRAQETSLLNEMGDLLQICNTVEEAYAIINRYTIKLFPYASGMMGILSASRNNIEVVVTWRDPSVIDLVFSSSTCWALRRAHLHSEDGNQAVNLCQHMKKPDTMPYLCIPMLAHGDLLGLLHIQYKQNNKLNNLSNGEFNLLDKSSISLAVSLAERVSLALSNLRLRETLREQAIRDPLTGLFNRRFMQESLEREVRRSIRANTPLTAMLFDIDHFKQFNDTFGHEAGDLLLHEVGQLLIRSVRTEDIVCRYGGEEFVIIMPGSILADSVRRAEQIREKINCIDINYDGKQLGKITISLGLASLSKLKPDGETLLRLADDAMYQAKAAGRNQVIFMKEDA